MMDGSFNLPWESSNHLSSARLEADLAWMISVQGDAAKPTRQTCAAPLLLPQTRLQFLATWVQDALGFLKSPSVE